MSSKEITVPKTKVHKAEIVGSQPPVKPKRKRHSPTIPFGDTLREKILEAAGITTKDLGQLARKAINKSEELLNATQKKFSPYQGCLGESVELPDQDTQLRAAKQILEFTGAFPSRSSDSNKGEHRTLIIVNVSWMKDNKTKPTDAPQHNDPKPT
ncbi:MAG: hypothetical protein ACE5IC_00075 [Candidatus Brocadiales bacterium]